MITFIILFDKLYYTVLKQSSQYRFLKQGEKMKKKLICGVITLLFLVCAPFYRLDLASGEPEPPKTLPAAAPDPEEIPVFKDGTYTLSLTSSVGLLTYYNQNDVRWADALYGGRDPIASYGCGPTALAMLVTSFTNQTYTPADMAYWAASNNYWSAGAGTKHNFFLEGAAAFGFHASSFQNFTPEGIISELKSGHVLVALMGPGQFTNAGHFIIIYDYWSGNQVSIADPASLERTQIPWDIQTLISELAYGANGGGPLWSISPK